MVTSFVSFIMGVSEASNIPKELADMLHEALGHRTPVQLVRLLQVELKTGKFETRAVVLCEFCLLVISTVKCPIKIEQSFSIVDVRSLDSTEPGKLVISGDNKKLVFVCLDDGPMGYDDIIDAVVDTYATALPASAKCLLERSSFAAAEQLERLEQRIKTVLDHVSSSPCGGFSTTYRCMSEYYNVPVVDEAVWDIDTIYHAQKSSEFCLNDFDHLDLRTFVPLLSALEQNMWFTKLSASNMKLTNEIGNEMLKVLKTNSAICEISLTNLNLRCDFIQRLSASLLSNSNCVITSLDLSGNAIEDKGLGHLLPVLMQPAISLTTLNLSRCSLTGRSIGRLSETLFLQNLRHLDLTDNCIKSDEMTNLYNCIAQTTNMKHLNLAGTECSLEALFGALLNSCCDSLTHLDVSHNIYSTKKLSKDVVVPTAWHDFFASSKSLQSVNFSGTRLPAEAIRSIMEGLKSNETITSLSLNLSNNASGAGGIQVMESYVASLSCVTALDISDNGLDHCLAGFLLQLGKNSHIRRLSIGRNLTTVKPKLVPLVVDALIQMTLDDRCLLASLCIDDMRLKADLATFLGTLATNNSLTELDLSGNQAGDVGARSLSKSLALNQTLKTIHWDRNNTSPQGFVCIANALHRNFTLKTISLPLTDVNAAIRINPEKTESALAKIEACLRRNSADGSHFQVDDAYRLNRVLITSSSNQILLSTVRELNLVIGQLSNDCLLSEETQEEVGRGLGLIKDAASAHELLSDLEHVAHSVDDENNALQCRLKAVASELDAIVQSQLTATVGDMTKIVECRCPAVFTNGVHEDMKRKIWTLGCTEPLNCVQDVIMERVGRLLVDKIYDASLKVATFLTEKMIEELLHAMDSTLISLKKALVQQTSLKSQGEENEVVRAVEGPSKAELFQKTLSCRKLRPLNYCYEHTIGESSAGSSAAESRDNMSSKLTMVQGDPNVESVSGSKSDSKPPVAKFRKRTSIGSSTAQGSIDTESLDATKTDTTTNSASSEKPTESDSPDNSDCAIVMPSSEQLTSANDIIPTKTDSHVIDNIAKPAVANSPSVETCTAVSSVTSSKLPAAADVASKAAVKSTDASQSSVGLDLDIFETDSPKLTHLCKDRPRPRKSRSVQQPIINQPPAGALIENAQNDDDDQFVNARSTSFGSNSSGRSLKQQPVVNPTSSSAPDTNKTRNQSPANDICNKSKPSLSSVATCSSSKSVIKPPAFNPTAALQKSPIFARAAVTRDSTTKDVTKSSAENHQEPPAKSREASVSEREHAANSQEPNMSSPHSLPRGRPPPLAPKPKKIGSITSVTTEPGCESTALSAPVATNATSKSANSSPAKFVQPSLTRGFSVRQYMKRFADAADKGDDVKNSTSPDENSPASDAKPPGDNIMKRRLSVREKAAAFLEASCKDTSY